MKITDIKSIEILDSRGNPTVRTFVSLEDGSSHASSVPSGASTGSHEAVELRDNDTMRYNGLGVTKAVSNVNTRIKTAIVGLEADPNEIDSKLLELDGTPKKSNLGANAILSVSMSVVRAAAHAQGKKLWEYMFEYFFKLQASSYKLQAPSFPQLMVNIVNGGKHASWNFDIQEFMIVPNTTTPSEAIRIASEIFHSLGKTLKERKLSTLVGDEGGYSPNLSSNEEVLDTIIEAASKAGYENIKDYRLSLDVASTEFFQDGKYLLRKPPKWITLSEANGQALLTPEELTAYYSEIGQKYFILSFEDPFAEDDWASWTNFTDMAEKFKFTTVGDDLLVTNPDRIRKAIDEKASSAVLVKVNQIGTIKETVEAINMAHASGWKTAISHRSGETEDNFIADLAYACGSEFIKTGSMSRSERLSKYNRLLEIEAGL